MRGQGWPAVASRLAMPLCLAGVGFLSLYLSHAIDLNGDENFYFKRSALLSQYLVTPAQFVPIETREIVDIIVRKISDYHNVPRRRSRTGRPLYRMGFKGPAKFDGSAVDWFNGRVFEAAVHMVFPGAQVTYTSLKPFGKPHMSIMEISRGSG